VTPNGSPEELTARLEAFLRRATENEAVRVENLRRLTGGASRETWSLDATIGGSLLPLILQRDAHKSMPKQNTRLLEYRLLEAARAAGVPAPEPMFFGDDSLDGEFFIVRRVEGETLPRRLLRDEAYAGARAEMTSQLGAILARIHTIPLDAPGLETLPVPEGESAAAHELARYEQTFRMIAPEPHPVFELAFRWVRAHLPPANERRALVHGDFRIGNVLFDSEGVQLILDWEISHAGDPMEDLAWMCVRSWRFGGDKPVGGIGEREEFFAAYEVASGTPVDPERVRFWEIFGNLRWGIICIGQARTYLDGRSNSLELASIGRRTAETEWELLSLIE
jgi:aminoglycoside phosphotransferase (APT) family kinase protein